MKKNYSAWEKQLVDHLYRTAKFEAWRCEALGAMSEPGETEADFRVRVTQLAREKRDEKKHVVRRKYEKRIQRAQEAVQKAESYEQQQKSQFWTRLLGSLLSIVQSVLGVFGMGRSRRFSTGGVNQTIRERGEASRASQRHEDTQLALEAEQADLQKELDQLEFDFEPTNLAIEKLELPPVKGDIRVDRVVLVWLPWYTNDEGTAQPAY